MVCGGACFIASHSGLVLPRAVHSLVVLANYSNSSPECTMCELQLAGADASGRMVRQSANPNGDAKGPPMERGS